MISFEEYCEDFLDLHVDLLSGESLEQAKRSYAEFSKPAPTIKAQKQAMFQAAKDDVTAMLAHHKIDKATFDAATLENLAEIRTANTEVFYKDAQRQLWHDYREALQKKIDNAFKPARKTAQEKPKGVQKALDNAKTARQASTALGGKALTGSAKQKSWGETLRKQFLQSATTEQVESILNAKVAQTAKFWIETRDLSVAEIIKKAGI